jgi:hypothetical protein
VAPGKPSAADTYLGFQQFLSTRSGQRITITVRECGKETSFNFEVPKMAAKVSPGAS